MIFEAHVRHRRHVLMTRDERAFMRGGRRERLQGLGNTWIWTAEEFAAVRDREKGHSSLFTPPS